MVWLIPINWLVWFRNWNHALLLLTVRVHDHDIIQRMLRHSNTSTGKTMNTNNNRTHLRRLKDKSSQHNLLTIRPPVRNVYVQLNNSRRPLSPDIQCWQGGAWVGVAKFRPFAQPPSADPTTGQHWMLGGRGVCKNNFIHAMLKYSCCELLSFNSPW